jgi:hypothetical protein
MCDAEFFALLNEYPLTSFCVAVFLLGFARELRGGK